MAVINVTPLTDITALIASDSVNQGDVLLLDEGIYYQTVIIPKNNIRIKAKGLIIGNTIKDSRTDALTITDQRNNFTAENYIECTRQAGIFHLGQFGTFLSNEISYSGNDGILLGSSVRDLVMDNRLTCNLPEKIN